MFALEKVIAQFRQKRIPVGVASCVRAPRLEWDRTLRLSGAFGTLAISMLTLVACQNPSERTLQPVPVNHNVRNCVEPPPDVLESAVVMGIDAKLPKVEEIVKANLSVEEKFQRIRQELPALQAWEVLEYRLCLACADGRITNEQYHQFLQEFLPRIIDASGNELPWTSIVWNIRKHPDQAKAEWALDFDIHGAKEGLACALRLNSKTGYTSTGEILELGVAARDGMMTCSLNPGSLSRGRYLEGETMEFLFSYKGRTWTVWKQIPASGTQEGIWSAGW